MSARVPQQLACGAQVSRQAQMQMLPRPAATRSAALLHRPSPPPPPPPPPPPLGLPSSRPRLQVIGQAFGNAAMILASGKKGYRYALPNSRIMTCPPRMNRAFGNTSNCMIKANELENSTQVGGGRGGGAGRCGGGKAVSEGGGVCERVAESLRAGQRGVLAPQRGQGSCKAKRQACTRSPHILLRTAAS